MDFTNAILTHPIQVLFVAVAIVQLVRRAASGPIRPIEKQAEAAQRRAA